MPKKYDNSIFLSIQLSRENKL